MAKTMKRIFALILFVALALQSHGAIKYFTDYPNNPAPPGYYAFPMDTGNHTAGGIPYAYITKDQMFALIYQNVQLTGAVNVVTITNNNFLGTNITIFIPGGLTNFNATPSTVAYWNSGNGLLSVPNGVGIMTNDGAGGVGFTEAIQFTNIFIPVITNITLVTTNIIVDVPGGFTNNNMTPLTVSFWDINRAESSIPTAQGVLTNDGVGGVGWSRELTLDELDANNFYPSNTFLHFTNALLSTDGNGQVTNASIGNGLSFSGNTLVATGTNTIIYASTNFSTNLYVQTFYGDTNYLTNLYFISGKGNTLIITNVSIEGVQTNKNIAASSAVITKPDQVLTNAVNAHGVFTNTATGPPSFGLLANAEMVNSSLTIAGTANQVSVSGGGPVSLGGTATLSLPNPLIAPGPVSATQLTNTSFAAVGVVTNDAAGKTYTTPTVPNALLANSSITIQGATVSLGGSTLAAGSSPAFSAENMTNFNYMIKTNTGGGNALVFGGVGTSSTLYTTNITAATTLAAFTITTVGGAGGFKLYCTCSGGTDRVLTFPGGCVGPGLGTPPAVTITNAKAAWFDVIVIPGLSTNVFWSPVF